MTEIFKPTNKYMLRDVASWIIVFIVAPIFIFILPLPLIYSYLWVRATEYEAREDGVFKKTGIIMKSQSMFLYKQIQDVEEHQNILDRILGFKRLRVVTMSGSSNLGGDITGLEIKEADRLKDLIIRNINRDVSAAKTKEKMVEKAAEISISPYKMHPEKAMIAAAIPVMLSVAIIAVVAGVISWSAPLFFIALLIGLSFAAFIAVASFVGVRFLSYEIGDEWIRTRYDFLITSVANYRYDRIQNVTISVPWGYRLMGMAIVYIETGENRMVPQTRGDRAANIKYNYIPAMMLDDAYRLKDLLLDRMNVETKGQVVNLRAKYPLESMEILKGSVSSSIILILLAILAIVFVPKAPVVTIAAAVAIIMALAIVYAFYYFKDYRYATTQSMLTIRKGVLGYSEVFIPYNRVQNIFLDMDILDRVLGLRDLHLATMGFSSGGKAHIDGLSETNSQKLKEEITNLTQKNRLG